MRFNILRRKKENYVEKLFKLILISTLLVLFYPNCKSIYALDNNVNSILILNSYNRDYSWTSEQVEGILEQMKTSPINFDTNIEYLDLDNLKEKDIESIKDEYKNLDIQAIITTDDTALKFTLESREKIFGKDVPIIFTGVYGEMVKDIIHGYDNVTGVIERLNFKDTLEEAFKINPNAENVYFIHDNNKSGNDSVKDVKEALKSLGKNVSLTELKNLELNNLDKNLPKINGESIVLLSEYSKTPSRQKVNSAQLTKILSKNINTPIFNLYDMNMGYGSLGGNILSGKRQGEVTGDLVSKVLENGSANGVPIIDGIDTASIYDYDVMKKYKISESEIPEGSDIINGDPKQYVSYKNTIWKEAGIIIVLLVLLIGMVINIVRRKRAELLSDKNEQKYKYLFEASNEGLWEVNLKTGKRVFSEQWYEKSKISIEKQGSANGWIEYVHADDINKIKEVMNSVKSGESEGYSVNYRVLDLEGKYRWIYSKARVMKDKNGKPYKLIGSHSDIHNKKVYEEKINKMAFSDNLTGLANRAKFVKNVNDLIKRGNQCTLAIVDLDNFKNINDSFGHSIGDKFLIEVAEKLKKCINDNDILARFGGDEFLILINGIIEKDNIKIYLDNIMKELKESVIIDGFSIVTSASIGVARYPIVGQEFEDLFKNADTALYKAKEYGKRNYVFFEQWMNEDIVEMVKIEECLRTAIDKNEFSLNYQPKYNIAKSKIDGFEALIRLNSKELGFVSPLKFIDIAERTGLIIPIGKWVLESSCNFIKRINENGYPDLSISVNVSVIQLAQKDFVDVVKDVIESTKVNPKSIEVEITESILIESIDDSIAKINELKRLGIKIALDDFGKGYSSLTYLKDIPVDVLKIDKAFIDEIEENSGNENIIGTIIKLAHQMNFKVVAEGVETKEQYNYLKENNCDLIQGYYISRPLIEKDAEDILYKNFEDEEAI